MNCSQYHGPHSQGPGFIIAYCKLFLDTIIAEYKDFLYFEIHTNLIVIYLLCILYHKTFNITHIDKHFLKTILGTGPYNIKLLYTNTCYLLELCIALIFHDKLNSILGSL